MLIIKEIARTYAIYKSYLKSINTLKMIKFGSPRSHMNGIFKATLSRCIHKNK